MSVPAERAGFPMPSPRRSGVRGANGRGRDNVKRGDVSGSRQAARGDTTVCDPVVRTLAVYRFHYADELQLQEGIEAALVAQHHHVEREVRLDARSRIDLLVDGQIGVEIKVAGSRGAAARQVGRYLRDERIAGLVLITSRIRHHMPSVVEGKPVVVVSLTGAGL